MLVQIDPSVLSQVIVVVGLLLVLLELLVGFDTGFDLVVIGITLVVGGLIGVATGSFALAIFVVVALCVVYIVFGRKHVKEKMTVFDSTHMNVDKLIGQEAVVVYGISPKKAGRVLLHDEEWRARSSKKCSKGEVVVIDSIDGVTLFVSKKLQERKKK